MRVNTFPITEAVDSCTQPDSCTHSGASCNFLSSSAVFRLYSQVMQCCRPQQWFPLHISMPNFIVTLSLSFAFPSCMGSFFIPALEHVMQHFQCRRPGGKNHVHQQLACLIYVLHSIQKCLLMEHVLNRWDVFYSSGRFFQRNGPGTRSCQHRPWEQ